MTNEEFITSFKEVYANRPLTRDEKQIFDLTEVRERFSQHVLVIPGKEATGDLEVVT